MKLHRLITLALAALLSLGSANAAQNSVALPSTGPMSLGTFVTSHLNPGLQTLLTCNSGATAPVSPTAYQCWFDTSTAPRVHKVYDGTSWVVTGYLDATSHVFAPYLPAGLDFTGKTITAGTYNSPTLVTPNIGVASGTSLTLSSPLGLASGGTAANLLATGGASYVLRQSSAGAAITVSQLAANNLSNGTTGSGAVVLANSPVLTGSPALGDATGDSLSVVNTPVANLQSVSSPVTSRLYSAGSAAVAAVGTTSPHPFLFITQGIERGRIAAGSPTFTVGVPGSTTGGIAFAGATSGFTTVNGDPIASGQWYLPPVTDQFIGVGTTNTLFNKSYDTASGTGNFLFIASVPVTANNGTGAMVRETSASLTTPNINVATATSINKVAITAPATSATLAIADGKTLTASNTLALTGTDGSSVAFGAGGTVAYQGGTLAQFASTTSAQLATLISNETGSGALVFGTTPTLVTPVLGAATATSLASAGNITISNATEALFQATSGTVVAKFAANSGGGAAIGTTSNNTVNFIANGSTRLSLPTSGSVIFPVSATFGEVGSQGSFGLVGLAGGTTTLTGASSGGGTWTLPTIATTDTVVGRATTDTLLGKTYDTAGAGNSLLINGVALTANTGTGALVRATSPSITTPIVNTSMTVTSNVTTPLPNPAAVMLQVGAADTVAATYGAISWQATPTFLYQRGGGTAASLVAVAAGTGAGTSIGRVGFRGSNSTTTWSGNSSSITGFAISQSGTDWSSTDTSGYLSFSTMALLVNTQRGYIGQGWQVGSTAYSVATDPGLGNLRASGWLKPGIVAVSALPTCNSDAEGARLGVSDASATTFASTVSGGGSNRISVYCNGTNWIVGANDNAPALSKTA